MVQIPTVVLGLLFAVAIAVGARFVSSGTTLPFTVLLVAAGFVVSVFDPARRLDLAFGPLFSHDVILYLFLPAIVFQGAAEIDFPAFRRNLPVFGTMVLVGLPTAVVVLGWLGSGVFGLPLLVALLFAAMVYPIDPVAVLQLYDEMGAPERLSVLTEGESLLDDGIAIVVFTTLFDLVRTADPAELSGVAFLSVDRLGSILVDFVVVGAGGLAVGFVVGYAVYRLQHGTDDRLNVFLLTIVAGYGSFFLAEHVLHLSGILAAVAAGLLLGSRGRAYAVDEETLAFLENVWEAVVFFLNTVLFIVIGVEVPTTQVLAYAGTVAAAVALVLGVRAVVVYAVTNLLNQVLADPIPLNYQHVVVWSGLHGVIPVALALSLGPGTPYGELLQTMVFGVVVGSMVVQGLLMPKVLRVTGVTSEGTGAAAGE